jgi:molybdenum cofactor biosynthesis protein MoaC
MAIAGVYTFESIDDGLPFVPLAARRALDTIGRRLSLEGWRSLSLEERRTLVEAGALEAVRGDAVATVDRATPSASPTPPRRDPDPSATPQELVTRLGPARPLSDLRWKRLSPLDRYALVKVAENQEKLALAYDHIVGVCLSHLTRSGEARMVDVGDKGETRRRAVASARVRTTPKVVQAIAEGSIAKGDVLAAARVAGILAAKRTPDLVPLCHPVRTTHAAIDFEQDAERGEVRVRATVEAIDRTGVEMEAMIAASVASLTVYDMIKSADRWATIDGLRLESKSGGKSGDVRRAPEGGST